MDTERIDIKDIRRGDRINAGGGDVFVALEEPTRVEEANCRTWMFRTEGVYGEVKKQLTSTVGQVTRATFGPDAPAPMKCPQCGSFGEGLTDVSDLDKSRECGECDHSHARKEWRIEADMSFPLIWSNFKTTANDL